MSQTESYLLDSIGSRITLNRQGSMYAGLTQVKHHHAGKTTRCRQPYDLLGAAGAQEEFGRLLLKNRLRQNSYFLTRRDTSKTEDFDAAWPQCPNS
jgi:hypothetical protein